jgi:N-acylneuraminate cytidylyltransferase
MANIAIIPARGGSKRIPLKNIKPFLGKPVIGFAINAALESKLFDEVMVSTDDARIAEVARQFGASVPFMRSDGNSSDTATTASVLLEVLENYDGLNRSFDTACCIYPTSVFTTPSLLREGYEKLKAENFQSVFSAVAFSYPIWRGLEELPDGRVKLVWPEFMNSRSQDLKKVIHDAGQWYWFKVDELRRTQHLFMERSGVIIMDENLVQDIDNETDWKLATLKYRLLNP